MRLKRIAIDGAKALCLTLFCVAGKTFGVYVVNGVLASVAKSDNVVKLIIGSKIDATFTFTKLLGKNCFSFLLRPRVPCWAHDFQPEAFGNLTCRFSSVYQLLAFLELEHVCGLFEDGLQKMALPWSVWRTKKSGQSLAFTSNVVGLSGEGPYLHWIWPPLSTIGPPSSLGFSLFRICSSKTLKSACQKYSWTRLLLDLNSLAGLWKSLKSGAT